MNYISVGVHKMYASWTVNEMLPNEKKKRGKIANWSILSGPVDW
jgi:hypothetical protein